MGETHPVVQAILQLGALAVALTGITIFIERVWGPVRKWLANALTNPLLDKLDEVKSDFDNHAEYVRHHLGPNGTTIPIHERIVAVDQRLSLVEQTLRKLGETNPDDKENPWD